MKTKNKNTELSFSFQWDNKKSAKSMVFGKKKPTATKNISSAVLPNTNKSNAESKATFIKPQSEKSIAPKIVPNSTNISITKEKQSKPIDKHIDLPINNALKATEESSEDVSLKGYVKRKNKKEKQLQKQGLLSNTNKQPQNDKSYNLFSVKKQEIYVNAPGGKSVSEKIFTTGDFKDFDLHKYLLSNLEKHSFTKPTNVQTKAIPEILSGKNTLVRSQTGSGKTLCYSLPILNFLLGMEPKLKRSDGVQVLVVVPTRELAMQTHELFSKINSFQWIVTGHLCGGENRKTEKDRIRKGVHILIGTPGRLLDHILHTTSLKIHRVRFLVLDEADRLLDMGFRKDIISIVEALDKSKSDSAYDPMEILKTNSAGNSSKEIATEKNDANGRQTVMLSATLTEAVSELANFAMSEHTFIDALDLKSNAVLDSYVIPDTVKQEFLITYVKHRLFTLAALLLSKCAANACKIFVFMASTQMVDYHYELFSKYLTRLPSNRGKNKLDNVALTEEDSDDDDDELEDVMDAQFFKLHGSMEQKERKEVFNGFRASQKGVLICTDVVARGIDVPAADCIVQYNGPQTDEDYLHRVGRTGRAGQSGSAIIFLTHEEQEYVDHLSTHRVFLKKRDADHYLQRLSVVMEEPNHEQAAIALQKRFEAAVAKDKDLYKSACFAYSTWSRFYNSYPAKMRKFFDFKKANLGHYVTSFALRATPTDVARVVRGQVADIEAPRLNKKLANHSDNAELQKWTSGAGSGQARGQKRKLNNKSLALMTSEFASGLEPTKKKKKNAANRKKKGATH